MLYEGELSALGSRLMPRPSSTRHLAAAGPSSHLSPALLSLPPFDWRPAPSTSPLPTVSWLRYTLRAPSLRAIEGLSCRRVARYILFISAATTKPRAPRGRSFYPVPGHFAISESIDAPNFTVSHKYFNIRRSIFNVLYTSIEKFSSLIIIIRNV